MKISSALEQAAGKMEAADVADARLQAASLLAFTLNKDRTFLITHPDDELTDIQLRNYQTFIERRAGREPFQHIVGKQEFYGLGFEVTPDVLIPRPETEILVEKAIELLRSKERPRICEIGTGSGCISIALLHELPTASAVAGDISTAAMAVAKRNAVANGVDERIEFVVSNVFEQIPSERFDAILSNPPYVPDSDLESLQAEVREYEPKEALVGGSDGLSVICGIVENAPAYLVNGGWLLMEIGFNQAEKVRTLFAPKNWTAFDLLPDLQGIPRIVVAKHL
jgi:release factor glutamine methyltransferase